MAGMGRSVYTGRGVSRSRTKQRQYQSSRAIENLMCLSLHSSQKDRQSWGKLSFCVMLGKLLLLRILA